MAQSIRMHYRQCQGRIRKNVPWDAVKARQAVVHASAAEVVDAEPSSIIGVGDEQDYMYNLGDADVWVSNVSPHHYDHYFEEPGGVEFILHVDYSRPVDVAVTLTLEDGWPTWIGN
ncbi:hypothetical protein [Streptomyces mirabilis]|uniref:hypothetical protein n=1 Tax=Streptomyces mirabilis TaxID=68239 RepID=UPI0036A73D3B